ncbi:MAG: glycosyl transferase family 1 [Crocinitomicaceae bacterium]|nr:glycosyl transferase family 1 [Crocinitomicaceae bacterium]|tara:strand:- start:10822 stop:11976 length:1155 start_codon:yes stop_codon:yes gene_type:complete
MKIAFVTDGISPYVIGGMQQHSASLGVELVKSGHIVDLFHFVYEGDKIPDIKEINNFYFNSNEGFNNVFCCFFPVSFKFPGHYLFNSHKYSKWVFKKISYQKDEYDFIYAKGFSAWETLKKRNKLTLKSKIGIKFHGYEMFQYAPNFKIKLQHFMLRPFVRMINNRADFIFSYGGKITNIINCLGVPKRKIIEIPSAIHSNWLKEKVPPTSNIIKFLFVGRYERRKGIQEINESILELSKKYNNLEFHFLGPIPKQKQLKIKNIKIVYYGLVKDSLVKKSIYDSCDVLLCPSYSEGMPNVILEGMSRGLAIITSDVGAISLMVCKKNGIIIDKINSINIIQAIIEISKDINKLSLLKQYSRNKVEDKFTWEKVSKLVNSKIENL